MTSRSQAKQITLGAQVASLVLAACAVGVAGVGLPWGETREFTPVEVSLPEPDADAPAQDPDGGVPDHRGVDFEGIVERFAMVGNAPRAAQSATTLTDPKGPESTTETTVTNEDTRYLGMVQIGARRSAMIVVDGKQRIVSQGGQTMNASGEPVRVLSIQPDHVVLAVNGERERVDKGERQTTASTTIERTAESVRRASENARQSAIESGDGASENPRADFERRRRDAIDKALDEGRITQEEAQRMLDRMNTSVQRRGGRDD